jgi:hypothetical protein
MNKTLMTWFLCARMQPVNAPASQSSGRLFQPLPQPFISPCRYFNGTLMLKPGVWMALRSSLSWYRDPGVNPIPGSYGLAR